MKILKEIHSTAELNRALDESNERAVLLFKHSRTCPISARAFREFESYLEGNPDPGVSYKLITVQTERGVSDEAAALLGIRHETPQAILVRKGRSIWNASHLEITVATLREAIEQG